MIQKSLTAEDKELLLQFKNLHQYGTGIIMQNFLLCWKLYNLEKLKGKNPKKHAQLYAKLKDLLKNK